MGDVNITLLTIFAHLTLIVLEIYIRSRLLILNGKSMSPSFIIRCRCNQSDFLCILFLWTFLLLLIIFNSLHYLLLCDLRLINDASHSGIEPISLLIGPTGTILLSSHSHIRLAGTSVHL
jgi:hypothetical protein